MNERTKQLEMTETDLLGHGINEVICDQCSSGCGYRIGRVLDGEAFIMCSRKDGTQKVLSALKRR